jgi:hypothetical protein
MEKRLNSLDGNVISEYKILNIDENSSMQITENDRILLNDIKNCVLYYK